MDKERRIDKLLRAMEVLTGLRAKHGAFNANVAEAPFSLWRSVCKSAFDQGDLFAKGLRIENFAWLLETSFGYSDQEHILEHIIKNGTIVGSLPPNRCETYAQAINVKYSTYQAARLTLGIDPELYEKIATQDFEAVIEREKLLKDTIERKPNPNLGEALNPSFTLREILRWAHDLKIDVHEPLKQAYDRWEKIIRKGGSPDNPYGDQTDQVTNISEKDQKIAELQAELAVLNSAKIDKNERTTLESMILAMAWDKYEFGKNSPKSSTKVGAEISRAAKGDESKRKHAGLKKPSEQTAQQHLDRIKAKFDWYEEYKPIKKSS